ncbi:activator of stress protein 1 [Fusarium phyllophilum]|uniref:Activator of stress protein 1 n=1 Tax=Fusarium phyllophilum TaxID=47803 RepID=A0A8H5K9G4_9HYPO|nr:activator of stress protein 1 [Fusarium phyllophilum]
MASTCRNTWCAICGVTIESHIIKLRLMWPRGFSTYDPDVVCDANVEWLDQVHLLGYNPLAVTISKFYVSDVAIVGRGVDMATETRTDPAFAGVDRKAGLLEHRCLSLDYGEANEAQKDYWECITGQEYTVFSPQSQVHLKDDIATYISGPEFDKPRQYHHEAKGHINPLTLLPETIMSGVAEDIRRIFLWADAASKPRSSVTKLMFSVANRQRIWNVCEQIGKVYKEEPQQKAVPKSYLACQARNSERQVLGDTGEPGLYFRTAHFLQGWAELSSPWTLDLFWNSEGDLSGIAVTFGQDQRIFGHETHESGACQSTGSFSGGVWIEGFVFHIYASSALRPWQACSWNYSSCKGVTVHLTDGSEHMYGQNGEHLLRMPFAAAENMTIVGMKGTLATYGISPFIDKIRILQAATNGGHFSQEPLKHRDQDVSCWNPANCMFKSLISPTDELKLNLCKGRIRNFERWHCLVPLNTLILANDTSELSHIRSISAYLIRDPICLNPWNAETRCLRDVDDDGSTWPEQRWDTFQIDGPGGEVIEEVIVHHGFYRDPSPKAIEICTNRGRSVIWGVDMERGENGEETNDPCPPIVGHRLRTHLRPEDGFSIVGLVMGCGKVFGRWHSDEYHVERSKPPSYRPYSRRLKGWGEDYIDEEESWGPWTKEQYDRRNESTIHTGISKFGIITKRITEQGI